MGQEVRARGALARVAASLVDVVACLEEVHAPEIMARHFGDDPAGCSYCAAIRRARTALWIADGQLPKVRVRGVRR